MPIGELAMHYAYRRARNALCFERPHFAVTGQLDNTKAVASHHENMPI